MSHFGTTILFYLQLTETEFRNSNNNKKGGAPFKLTAYVPCSNVVVSK